MGFMAERPGDEPMKRLEAGKYSHLVIAPIEMADFEPDIISFYGTPAQVMRLVQAARPITGQVSAIASGFADCGDQVARTTLSRFSYYLIFPYHSIYIVALGATATQLGIVNSAGMCLAGVLSPLAGWLVDRTGAKPIYLMGIGLLIASYLTYGVAQSWVIIIIAMMAYQLGEAVSIQSCAVVCGNSLANENRATGMGFCETFALGLMTMAGPMLGAWLVTTFGGVSVSGIRPLFFVSLAITVVSFLLIRAQLSNRRWASLAETGASFFKDLSQVFKQGRSLKRWLVIVSITWIPYGTILPFTQVFAHEVKGAEQYILGAMATGMALTPFLL